MKIKVIGRWSSETLGNVEDGDILDIDAFVAEQYIQRGYAVSAEGYETKVVRQTPRAISDVPLASGQGSGASLSPVAPASPKKTAKSSKVKK